MGAGRRGQEAFPPWILKISAKRGCFLSFEWEKITYHFWPPLEKFWKNPLVPPLEKFFRRPWTRAIDLESNVRQVK